MLFKENVYSDLQHRRVNFLAWACIYLLVFVNMSIKRLANIVFVLGIAAGAVLGQAVAKVDLSPAEIERVIKKFSQNEATFREALNSYAFNRSAMISTVGLGGNITGTYRRDSYLTFNSEGVRFEKIEYMPLSTLTELSVTAEDLEDLGGINPFALEPSAISQYNITYVGSERIDGIDLYVFDVTPKVIPDPKKSKLRLFTGRIWVDRDDPMIVRSKGKAVPETKKNRFPVVETTRLPIDNKYYFPVDVRSDDELVFESGQVIRLRMRVTYKNYRVGRSEVRILDDDPSPTPTPKATPASMKPED